MVNEKYGEGGVIEPQEGVGVGLPPTEDKDTALTEMFDVDFDLPEPLDVHVNTDMYPEIAFSIAMAGDMDSVQLTSVLTGNGLTLQQYNYLLSKPAFMRCLNEAKAFIAKLGAEHGFKIRARFYAERLADSIYRMAHSPSTEANIRLKAFETLVRLADLDPGTQKGAKNEGGGNGVVINIGAGIRGVSAQDSTLTVEMDNG